MTIDQLIIEALTAKDHFWFIKTLTVVERTDSTITLHFAIGSELFIQIFFSQRSGRINFALISTSGRLYGRDREYGLWHRHPFEHPAQHEPTPEGMSTQPITQFLADVEEILVEHKLM